VAHDAEAIQVRVNVDEIVPPENATTCGRPQGDVPVAAVAGVECAVTLERTTVSGSWACLCGRHAVCS